MTTCDSIDLISYLEGHDPQHRAAEHLKTCPGCRRSLRQYRQLLQALLADRHGCPRAPETVSAALGEAGADRRHLGDCELCRERFDGIRESMDELEKKTAAETTPLPDTVREQIRKRRQQWLKGRLHRVLDLQGVRDEKERQARTRKILDDQEREWPKAAFPEDLAPEEPEDEK